jgi:hypothetical protein
MAKKEVLADCKVEDGIGVYETMDINNWTVCQKQEKIASLQRQYWDGLARLFGPCCSGPVVAQ